MYVETERVDVKEITVGDYILVWESKAVRVDRIENLKNDTRLFYASDANESGNKFHFVRAWNVQVLRFICVKP